MCSSDLFPSHDRVGVRCDGWVFLVFLRRAMGWGEDSVLCSVGDGAF